MTMTIRKAVLGVLLLGGLSLGVVAPAHAGCCGGGGGGYRGGGSGGGHTFGRTYYAGYGGGCGCSMNMGGMQMGGLQMPAGSMQGMNMGGHAYPQAPVATAPAAAPATNGARYTCSMHPNVVSSTPGACPFCGMALTRK